MLMAIPAYALQVFPKLTSLAFWVVRPGSESLLTRDPVLHPEMTNGHLLDEEIKDAPGRTHLGPSLPSKWTSFTRGRLGNRTSPKGTDRQGSARPGHCLERLRKDPGCSLPGSRSPVRPLALGCRARPSGP